MSVFCLQDPDAVFIGIPKTASSTIREGIWKKRYKAFYGVGMPAFAARLIAGGQESFTFIRHPFERLASAYRDFTQIRGHATDPRNFVEIVLDPYISFELFAPNNKIRHHTLPLTHNAYALDFAQHVFRFECIDRHLPYVCQKFGVDVDLENLPHIKPTVGDGYESFMQRLKPQQRKRLAIYYAEDAERFGYDLSV